MSAHTETAGNEISEISDDTEVPSFDKRQQQTNNNQSHCERHMTASTVNSSSDRLQGRPEVPSLNGVPRGILGNVGNHHSLM